MTELFPSSLNFSTYRSFIESQELQAERIRKQKEVEMKRKRAEDKRKHDENEKKKHAKLGKTKLRTDTAKGTKKTGKVGVQVTTLKQGVLSQSSKAKNIMSPPAPRLKQGTQRTPGSLRLPLKHFACSAALHTHTHTHTH